MRAGIIRRGKRRSGRTPCDVGDHDGDDEDRQRIVDMAGLRHGRAPFTAGSK